MAYLCAFEITAVVVVVVCCHDNMQALLFNWKLQFCNLPCATHCCRRQIVMHNWWLLSNSHLSLIEHWPVLRRHLHSKASFTIIPILSNKGRSDSICIHQKSTSVHLLMERKLSHCRTKKWSVFFSVYFIYYLSHNWHHTFTTAHTFFHNYYICLLSILNHKL